MIDPDTDDGIIACYDGENAMFEMDRNLHLTSALASLEEERDVDPPSAFVKRAEESFQHSQDKLLLVLQAFSQKDRMKYLKQAKEYYTTTKEVGPYETGMEPFWSILVRNAESPRFAQPFGSEKDINDYLAVLRDILVTAHQEEFLEAKERMKPVCLQCSSRIPASRTNEFCSEDCEELHDRSSYEEEL